MDRQILPDFPLVPNQDRIELDQSLVAFLDFLEVYPCASLGAAEAGHPTGHVHFLDCTASRLNLQNIAAEVRIHLIELVGNGLIVAVNFEFRISRDRLIHEFNGLLWLESSSDNEASNVRANPLGQVPDGDRILAKAVDYNQPIPILLVCLTDQSKRAVHLLSEVETLCEALSIFMSCADQHVLSSPRFLDLVLRRLSPPERDAIPYSLVRVIHS